MDTIDPSYLWLIAGAVFLAVEAFGVPGIGFLFAGLAAVIVAILAQFDVIGADNLLAQAAWFFCLTAALAAALWKKLKSWRINNGQGGYNNIVGDNAVVGQGGLHVGRIGQVSWSGTTMMAEMAVDCGTNDIEAGEIVEIVDVRGSKLIVAPRKTSR